MNEAERIPTMRMKDSLEIITLKGFFIDSTAFDAASK